jgi:two-component system response regulator MprA
MTLLNLTRRKKILVVEDEPQLAESLEARLQLEGFHVVKAADGKEGVDQARTHQPDLVIMDLMLPKVNGFDACKMIKADGRTKHIPVLVLTALQTLGDTNDAFDSGADDFLAKPCTGEKLLAKVRKLLGVDRA